MALNKGEVGTDAGAVDEVGNGVVDPGTDSYVHRQNARSEPASHG